MNPRRLVVLLLAFVAAGGTALLVGRLLGSGPPKADAHPVAPAMAMSEVLVAATNLQPGTPLAAGQVQWQKWPSASVNPGFIVGSRGGSPDAAVAGAVVRAPIVTGEPITFAKIVKSDATGFMAAMLQPGMRAVSITASVASIAGGFILPNDRADIISTQTTNDNPKRVVSRIVLSDVRVLAIDQASDNRNQKAVAEVKTVTLELSPSQSGLLASAQAAGTLSLALRGLGERATALNGKAPSAKSDTKTDGDSGQVTIIRYGVAHTAEVGGGN
jgi:pilus assembly protein CpaB